MEWLFNIIAYKLAALVKSVRMDYLFTVTYNLSLNMTVYVCVYMYSIFSSFLYSNVL